MDNTIGEITISARSRLDLGAPAPSPPSPRLTSSALTLRSTFGWVVVTISWSGNREKRDDDRLTVQDICRTCLLGVQQSFAALTVGMKEARRSVAEGPGWMPGDKD